MRILCETLYRNDDNSARDTLRYAWSKGLSKFPSICSEYRNKDQYSDQ